MIEPSPATRPAPSPPSAPKTQRLWVDATGERQGARLRLLAALLALLGGLWLLAVAQPWWLRGVGITGCAFAFLWARRHWNQRAHATAEQPDFLEIGEHHLALCEGSQARRLPLARIKAVEIDDDRLVVVLRLDDGEPWLIEPRYRGVGLRELAERLHQAVQAEQAARAPL